MKNILGDQDFSLEDPLGESCGQLKGCKLGETEELKDLQGQYGTWFIDEQAYRLFYGTIPFWEHEEMGGVFSYLITKMKPIHEEIAEDLRRLRAATPCEFFWDILPIEQRPPACDIEIERGLVTFPNHFERLAGLGPLFLYRVLHMDRLSRPDVICGPWNLKYSLLQFFITIASILYIHFLLILALLHPFSLRLYKKCLSWSCSTCTLIICNRPSAWQNQ